MRLAKGSAQAAPLLFLVVVSCTDSLCASRISSPEIFSQLHFFSSFRPPTAALNYTSFPYLESCLPAGGSLGLRTPAVWHSIAFMLGSTKTEFRILTLGGSETAGHGCSGGGSNDMHGCAWSGRLVSWLQATYPVLNFSHTNKAVGGLRSRDSIHHLQYWLAETIPQLIFLDFTINDFEDDCGPDFIGQYEVLLQTIAEQAPHSRVVFLISEPKRTTAAFRDMVILLSVEYTFAIVSYYDVVSCATLLGGGNRVRNATELQYWGNQGHHPPWIPHELMALTVATSFTAAICRHTHFRNASLAKIASFFTSNETRSRLEPCKSTTRYAANDFKLSPVTSTWRRVEEKPGVFAFVCTSETPEKKTLKFEVMFGSAPRLVVAFLKSYETLGDISLTLNNKTVSFTGIYDKGAARVSQMETVSLMVGLPLLAIPDRLQKFAWLHDHVIYQGFGIQPLSKHRITVELLPSSQITKFVIYFVSAC